MIINTCGWVDQGGYELLQHSIRTFRADIILVLGNERLYSDLRQSFGSLRVVNMPKSGGVVPRSPAFRRNNRVRKMREYFYGFDNTLSPLVSAVNFSEVAILQVGSGPQAPSSALPIGAERLLKPCQLTAVLPSQDLLHAVLAVSQAQTREEVETANIAGFVKVTEVKGARSQLLFLAPCAGPLPGRFLLLGRLRWLEA
mmetsp:Transcript_20896/g.52933  ORF Transcript_20896/g.52933 Transcript_20896/m.52933 type:complete len:199 (+) Transcript_20896:120-716(+)